MKLGVVRVRLISADVNKTLENIEKSGVEAAQKDLFKNKCYVIVEDTDKILDISSAL